MQSRSWRNFWKVLLSLLLLFLMISMILMRTVSATVNNRNQDTSHEGDLRDLRGCREALVSHRRVVFTAIKSGSQGELLSATKIFNQIKKLTPNESISQLVLDATEKGLQAADKKLLMQSGLQICTVDPLLKNDTSNHLKILQLWAIEGPDLIVYIDTSCYVASDISGLLTLPTSKFGIGATLDHGTDWLETFNGQSVFKISPSTKYRDIVLKGIANLDPKTTLSGYLNSVFGPNGWYDIGFRYAANTKVFENNWSFWETHLPDVRIIYYSTVDPWNSAECRELHSIPISPSTDLCEMWWGGEGRTSSLPPSRFHKLWHRQVTDPLLTAVPLGYYPRATPDPLPHQFNSTPDRLDENPIIRDDYFIQTVDRRVHRIPRKVSTLNHRQFPNSAIERDRIWKIVMGIPSTDTPKGSKLRGYQRGSFFQYVSVWNVHRHPDSQILIKYILAYHPSHDYDISESLRREAARYRDILFFDIKEGAPLTTKDNRLLWERKPVDMLVGMSRKTYAWFAYAADTYKTDYVVKGDDDAFYRCNMLLNELTAYHVPRVYYGRKTHYPGVFGLFRTTGMIIGLSFDLVDWIRDSTIVEDFTDFIYEDVMVGLWFYKAHMTSSVHNMSDCRCHDITGHFNVRQDISNSSMVVHHMPTSKGAYTELFKRFLDPHLRPLKTKTKAILESMLEEPWETVYWNERYACPSQYDVHRWKLEHNRPYSKHLQTSSL
eukprot:TRINITY_DN8332_c0_g1_i1.p1 TRINITY_DN8332_c0_g1~~TRINITY_DN8332_c0_g1_i1.p1  ORF type:complete len:752 (+),score=99.54 TRINITY_DN8332_c0_g1_i1:105-2258(+)